MIAQVIRGRHPAFLYIIFRSLIGAIKYAFTWLEKWARHSGVCSAEQEHTNKTKRKGRDEGKINTLNPSAGLFVWKVFLIKQVQRYLLKNYAILFLFGLIVLSTIRFLCMFIVCSSLCNFANKFVSIDEIQSLLCLHVPLSGFRIPAVPRSLQDWRLTCLWEGLEWTCISWKGKEYHKLWVGRDGLTYTLNIQEGF